MQEGKRVRRVKGGLALKGKDKGQPDPFNDDAIGEEGTITRIYSFKWMKIDIDGEAEIVRVDHYEEV